MQQSLGLFDVERSVGTCLYEALRYESFPAQALDYNVKMMLVFRQWWFGAWHGGKPARDSEARNIPSPGAGKELQYDARLYLMVVWTMAAGGNNFMYAVQVASAISN